MKYCSGIFFDYLLFYLILARLWFNILFTSAAGNFHIWVIIFSCSLSFNSVHQNVIHFAIKLPFYFLTQFKMFFLGEPWSSEFGSTVHFLSTWCSSWSTIPSYCIVWCNQYFSVQYFSVQCDQTYWWNYYTWKQHNSFRTIPTKHHVPLGKCEPRRIDFFTYELKRLSKTWRDAKGSSGHSKLLKQCEDSAYIIKIKHKTGSPAKRKLEQELINEQVKRKALKMIWIKWTMNFRNVTLINRKLTKKTNHTISTR